MTDSLTAPVAIIATLDTKAVEADFLRAQVAELGARPLLIDAGVFPASGTTADIDRNAVAERSGVAPDVLPTLGKAKASEAVARGVAAVLEDLHLKGGLSAVIALGGGAGTWVGATAMQVLPIGIPKIVVSPIPMRDIKPIVGSRDILVFHSVVDLMGLNPLLRDVLFRAAVAAIAMARTPTDSETPVPTIGLTAKGITQVASENFRQALEAQGYEVMAFHASGMGGRAMDELVAEGRIDGIIDLTTQELTGELFGGTTHCDHKRFIVPGRRGIPQIICPGAIETLSIGRNDAIPEIYADRPHYAQGPTFTHVRVGLKELEQVADALCERLNGSRGKVAILMPRQGFSVENREGGAIYSAEENRAFEDMLRARASEQIEIHALDCHLDDPAFAAAGVRLLKKMESQ